MSNESLYVSLRDANAGDWSDYVDHAFVRGIGDGTLPVACFRHYLIQDYLFLIQFARAYALAGYKSQSLEEIREAAESLRIIITILSGRAAPTIACRTASLAPAYLVQD